MKSEQLILEELKIIRKEVEEIKEHMVDVDTILTTEEKIMLDESIKREKEGKRSGGLGIFLAKVYMDEIRYNETGNEVTLIKYFEKNVEP